MSKSDNNERNDIELLREIRFVGESKYVGSWDAIDKTGTGRYVTPYKVLLEGDYRNGMLHGRGSIYWPRGQIMDGIWDRGRLTQMRYTFADGLLYQEDEWNYCTFPDRRFYNSIINGLRPAGKVLKTNDLPTKIIPPFCYDTGAGIFDPNNNCIISYRNCKKILKISTMAEGTWIKKNCRKGWLKPTGQHTWLQKYWQSGTADFTELSEISTEDEMENWWQRLTRFRRHSQLA